MTDTIEATDAADDLAIVFAHYDFGARRGVVHLASERCANMADAVALFSRIDSTVQRIDAVAAGELVAVYRRRSDGRWIAEEPSA